MGEVREELKKKLDQDYYVNATVELAVGDRGPSPTGPGQKNGFVMVFGEGVGGKTQEFPIPADEGLQIFRTVVVLAQPNEFANLKKVRLMRADPKTNKTVDQYFNILIMKEKGVMTNNIYLKDGDRIEIPAKGLFIN